MSVLSKYFQDAMASATCKDIIHPHTDSCIQAAYGYFLKPVLTTMQFFLPLFMISVAAKKDDYNRKVVLEMIKNFMGAVAAGLLTGSIGTLFMCGLYKLLNRFEFYSIVAYPGVLGALSIFAVPNKIAVMFAHSALVMVIEVLIKGRGNILFSYMDRIHLFRVLSFMFFSTIILDSLRNVKPEVAWFIQPVRYKSKRRYECYKESPIFDALVLADENVCSHKGSCDAFIFKELKTYFKIGMALEFVRSLIKHFVIVKSNPLMGIYTIFRRFNFKFVLFAFGYPSGYRIFTCILNRLYGFETKIANMIAAFMAGIFFCAYPDLPFLAHAIACSIEIVWQRYQKSKRSKTSLIRQVHKLPLSKIFYPIFMGFLFHMRTFYPWQTPMVVMKVMNLVSGGHTDEMISNVLSFVMPTNTQFADYAANK